MKNQKIEIHSLNLQNATIKMTDEYENENMNYTWTLQNCNIKTLKELKKQLDELLNEYDDFCVYGKTK